MSSITNNFKYFKDLSLRARNKNEGYKGIRGYRVYYNDRTNEVEIIDRYDCTWLFIIDSNEIIRINEAVLGYQSSKRVLWDYLRLNVFTIPSNNLLRATADYFIQTDNEKCVFNKDIRIQNNKFLVKGTIRKKEYDKQAAKNYRKPLAEKLKKLSLINAMLPQNMDISDLKEKDKPVKHIYSYNSFFEYLDAQESLTAADALIARKTISNTGGSYYYGYDIEGAKFKEIFTRQLRQYVINKCFDNNKFSTVLIDQDNNNETKT